MPTSRLHGRVAIVTGAGRGIGAATARTLAAEGATVVVNDLGVSLDGRPTDASDAATEVIASIEAAGGTATPDGTDVSDHEATRAMVTRVVDEHGRLDIVVNVAGILRDRMIFNMTVEEWSAVLDVHLTGTFNMIRHTAAHWRATGESDPRRRVINITSASGLYGATAQPNYAAAKMGVVGLTYSSANALTRLGATCNAVSPAAATRMTETTGREVHPEDPVTSPQNPATAIAWLASDDAAWCNGQVVSAKGYDVALYTLPRPAVTLGADHPWSLDELAVAADREFRPVVDDLPSPTWPPSD